MDCNKCVLQNDNGYGVCTRQNINAIDGYCWLEKHLRECYVELGYESHDCMCCPHVINCRLIR